MSMKIKISALKSTIRQVIKEMYDADEPSTVRNLDVDASADTELFNEPDTLRDGGIESIWDDWEVETTDASGMEGLETDQEVEVSPMTLRSRYR